MERRIKTGPDYCSCGSCEKCNSLAEQTYNLQHPRGHQIEGYNLAAYCQTVTFATGDTKDGRRKALTISCYPFHHDNTVYFDVLIDGVQVKHGGSITHGLAAIARYNEL